MTGITEFPRRKRQIEGVREAFARLIHLLVMRAADDRGGAYAGVAFNDRRADAPARLSCISWIEELGPKGRWNAYPGR